ncbi:putative protein phosphatase 2C 43 [Tasmannia lanceolata]|uniref:putative protein phosphatase 2C 43 n=1 Tax=Tasmannia lanceolata TaxID=3420 RepID=UPI004062ED5C
MFSYLRKLVTTCWLPVDHMNKDDDGKDDPLLWSRDLDRHSLGEFSIAVVQANEFIEDHCQVETSSNSTFIGVYDGHGGPDASRFIANHLFLHLMRLVRENKIISEDILRSAFAVTESSFLAHVRRALQIKPLIAAMGSCCLVGIIWGGTLYVANVGDSRAVIGRLTRSNNIVAEQLTRDHNASMEEVRQELMSLHPDDPHILVCKQGAWRIKGIIQVSRSIGDAYLKKPEFSLDPSNPRFGLPEPLRRPVLTAEPFVYTRAIHPQDKFLIFASDGLWELVTNQEAAEIVYKYPRAGIARKLIIAALQVAARNRKTSYAQIKRMGKGQRRNFHDDITVVVVFIDHELLEANAAVFIDQELREANAAVPKVSVRGFIDTVGPSDFSTLEGIDVGSRLPA